MRGQEPSGVERAARLKPSKHSLYTGVSRNGCGYQAYVHAAPHRSITVGIWDTEREAALARDRAVLWLGLDRRLNLPTASRRLGACSPEELRAEARRRARANKPPPSPYAGVERPSRWARWSATVAGHVIARFDDEISAAIARDRVMLELYGPDAKLNFPELGLSPATIWEIKAWARRQINEKYPTSRYRGVHRVRNRHTDRPWSAQIAPVTPNGKQRTLKLGCWPTELAAAHAYDRAALYYFGPGAPLNLPRAAVRAVPADAKTIAAESRRRVRHKTGSRLRSG